MNELLKDLSDKELYDLIYTWWSFYRISAISVELDDFFKGLINRYPKEILACATCMHKDKISNDNLVNAIAEGYGDSFLRGIAISIGLFFDSQEDFDKEFKELVNEVRGLQQLKGSYSYISYYDDMGNIILS